MEGAEAEPEVEVVGLWGGLEPEFGAAAVTGLGDEVGHEGAGDAAAPELGAHVDVHEVGGEARGIVGRWELGAEADGPAGAVGAVDGGDAGVERAVGGVLAEVAAVGHEEAGRRLLADDGGNDLRAPVHERGQGGDAAKFDQRGCYLFSLLFHKFLKRARGENVRGRRKFDLAE